MKCKRKHELVEHRGLEDLHNWTHPDDTKAFYLFIVLFVVMILAHLVIPV